ncbi:hypothetical protein CSV79_09415 [Sporosarcina sp. P13]|uniref:ABC transporter substrate-binding protein n=1 Tax=Sporosarcina sp. P13 TaxID=2048263 RepID=UPI000C1633E8|nr:ABC transporter substrate-binding protein [Sporosarcina sp. P13]PIC63885.1 hypothetical protein CSV79_09415 [Sporosarcina sp. P13]
MKNTRKFTLVLFIAISMLLVACTANTADESPKDSDANSNSNSEKKTDIVIAVTAEPTTLMGSMTPDFSVYSINKNIYDRLIDYDGKGNFTPKLATEWKSVDELTWEFKLREDVKFHNGAPFNAESIKYTIDYMLDPANKSVYGSRWKTNLEELKVIDDYTVQFITKTPMAGFLSRAVTDFQFIEPGYVEEVGVEEASNKPIGTGPYKLKEWKKSEYLVFEANEDYWNGAPEIKEAKVRFIPEFSSRLSALLSGDVDLIASVPVDSMERIESDSDSKIISGLTGRPSQILLNTFKEGPLQDVKVRQALNYAIDVDMLLENVMNGQGKKQLGTLTPINLNYTEVEGYGYDPEKALELIAEAGYKPEDIKLTFNTTNGFSPMDSQVTQAIAGELEKLGLDITIQQVEAGVFMERLGSQKIDDMAFMTFAASTDAESYLSFLFAPTGTYRWHNDPELSKEIGATFNELDPEKRQKNFSEIQHRLHDEAVSIPLWTTNDIWGGRKDIEFKPRFDEILEINDIKRGE